MSLNVKYKANQFLKNLESLENFFEYLTKLSALNYEEKKELLENQQTGLVFYPNFYIERIKNLKKSLKNFFESNDLRLSELSDFYVISMDFKDNLDFSKISVFINDVTEDSALEKNFKKLKTKEFYKDQVLINYLIDLEKALEEKNDLHWLEWIKKYTKIPLKEKKDSIPEYSSACFGAGTVDYIIKKEISELDKLAYKLQKNLINDFDSFIETTPQTYINNQLTEIGRAHV